jgi:hypothetical protein
VKVGYLEGQNGVIDIEISGKEIGFDNALY